MKKRSLDAILQLVADRHRRQAVRHLRNETNGEATIEDLVEALGEEATATDERTTDGKHLGIQLYHSHLPKLAGHGVVEFDPESGTVRYQPDEQLETVLDSLPDGLSVASP